MELNELKAFVGDVLAIDGMIGRDTALKLLDAMEVMERRIKQLERNQDLNLKIKQAMHERFTRAEAELARRDAAAGEPIGYGFQHKETGKFGTVMMPKSLAHDCEVYFAVPLYTAAPPAEFPPATDKSQGWKIDPEYLESIAERSSDCDGVNPSLETVESVLLALGAQPQKVVVLEDVESDAILNAWDYQRSVFNSLDAANVKYEVKK